MLSEDRGVSGPQTYGTVMPSKKTILDRQERKTQSFRVDNGFLKADSIGLGLRKSKDMKVQLGEDQWMEDERGTYVWFIFVCEFARLLQ